MNDGFVIAPRRSEALHTRFLALVAVCWLNQVALLGSVVVVASRAVGSSWTEAAAISGSVVAIFILGWFLSISESVEPGSRPILASAMGFGVLAPSTALAAGVFGGIERWSGRFATLGVFLAWVFVAVIRQVRSCGQYESRSLFEVDWLPLLGVAAISVASLLTKMWFFIGPFAGGLGLFTAVVAWSDRLSRSRLAIALKVSSGMLIILLAEVSNRLARSPLANGSVLRSWDQYFRAAISFGTTRWGIEDHIGATGTPVRYHWLGEATISLLAAPSGASAVDVVTRWSPLLVSFVAGSAMVFLVTELGGRIRSGLLAVGMLTSFSSLTYDFDLNALKTTDVGQAWGTAFLLISTALLLRAVKRPTVEAISFFVTSHMVLSATNATLGVAFLVGGVAFLIITASTGRIQLRTGMTIGLPIVAGSALLFLTLFRVPDDFAKKPQLSLRAWSQLGTLVGYRGASLLVGVVFAAGLFALVWIQAGGVVGISSCWDKRGSKEVLRALPVLVVLAGVGLASTMIIEGTEHGRFLNALLILGPSLAVLQTSKLRLLVRAVPLWILIGLCLLVAAVGSQLYPTIQGSPLRVAAALIVLLLIPPVVSLLLGLTASARGISPSARLVGLSLLVSLLTIVTFEFRRLPDNYRYAKSIESARSEEATMDAELNACISAVVSRTSPDAIIASNMIRISDDYSGEKTFLVSAISQRRTVVDGPLFVRNPRPRWLSDRVTLVDSFASQPDKSTYGHLKSYGVEYFIVDRRWTDRLSWEPWADLLVSNQHCVVLRLR